MWSRLKILRCLLLPWPLIAPLLLLGRPPRAAHSLLHGRTKLLKRLGISSVHLLGHTTEILTGLNDVSIVAVQTLSASLSTFTIRSTRCVHDGPKLTVRHKFFSAPIASNSSE